jgi:hypothetical protein
MVQNDTRPAVAASGTSDADGGPIHTGIHGLCPGRTPSNPGDYFTGSSTRRCNSSIEVVHVLKYDLLDRVVRR